MFNNDLHYADSRIRNSIVKTKSGLLYVDRFKAKDTKVAISSSNDLDNYFVEGWNQTGEFVTEDLSNIFFSVGRLGYAYFNGAAQYLLRLPLKRSFKQGLRVETVAVLKSNKAFASVGEVLFNSTEFKSGLSCCLHDSYPSLDCALEILEESGGSVPLSRSFAIDDFGSLFYKGEVVGKEIGKDKVFKLKNYYNFLSNEFITEVGDESLAKL